MTTHHPYWLVTISLALALAPVVIGLFTSFIKVHIVLSFFRSGLGAQQVPSGLIILGLAVALTMTIMGPTINEFQTRMNEFPLHKLEKSPSAIKKEEVNSLLQPWREFLELHVGKRELLVFQKIAIQQKPKSEISELAEDGNSKASEIAWTVLLPAFVVTELREAFTIGFVILLPFLAIDLIVANLLAGVGMFMVSPVMISLPLKVALFTFADGWLLLSKGLTESYLLSGSL
ncbi:MAG: EscR/YscR/HrcR family type III secretion system export apparatus protein [Bdellovibrionales bacterium]|nr:EscR/YscR/HrcR family type III secretion system export apparatus protein [Bdellovibrionales bacterium]